MMLRFPDLGLCLQQIVSGFRVPRQGGGGGMGGGCVYYNPNTFGWNTETRYVGEAGAERQYKSLDVDVRPPTDGFEV